MKKTRSNICKLVDAPITDTLYIRYFVYETDVAEAMKKMSMWSYHAVGIVVNGSGVLKTEHQKKRLQIGTVFFTFSGNSFSIEDADSLHYIYILFNGGRAESILSRLGIDRFNCTFDGHEGLVSFWKTGVERANDSNIDLISESVFLYTLSELTPPSEKSGQYLLGDILEYIESNFTDHTFSLSSCADALGYNHKYISRIFKDGMKETFSEYVKNMRIRHAVFLMEQGITSIKNISILCGYRDPLYFSRVFKQSVGMSPSEYLERKTTS